MNGALNLFFSIIIIILLLDFQSKFNIGFPFFPYSVLDYSACISLESLRKYWRVHSALHEKWLV